MMNVIVIPRQSLPRKLQYYLKKKNPKCLAFLEGHNGDKLTWKAAVKADVELKNSIN